MHVWMDSQFTADNFISFKLLLQTLEAASFKRENVDFCLSLFHGGWLCCFGSDDSICHIKTRVLWVRSKRENKENTVLSWFHILFMSKFPNKSNLSKISHLQTAPPQGSTCSHLGLWRTFKIQIEAEIFWIICIFKQFSIILKSIIHITITPDYLFCIRTAPQSYECFINVHLIHHHKIHIF